VRVGKKFDFDGVAGESGRGAVWPIGGTKGNFWNPWLELGRRLLHFFSFRPAQHQSPKAEKRRAQGGSSDPEHRAGGGDVFGD